MFTMPTNRVACLFIEHRGINRPRQSVRYSTSFNWLRCIANLGLGQTQEGAHRSQEGTAFAGRAEFLHLADGTDVQIGPVAYSPPARPWQPRRAGTRKRAMKDRD